MPAPVLCITEDTANDLEAVALKYYERLYNQEPYPNLTVDEMLAILEIFRNSPTEREKKIFCRVLKLVYDEQKIIPTFPINKFIILAQIFGGFIEHGFLTDHGILEITLRIILNALKMRPQTKMYVFGIIALDRFKYRLKDLRHYCNEITKIPHFQQFPQYLIEFLECGKYSQQPPLSRVVDFDEVLANSTSNNDIESVETIIEPAINVQNKINDIINELNFSTMITKGREIMCILTRRSLPWFAQYLVTKRILVEMHNHILYRKFLNDLNNEYLNSLVLSETYKNIKILLENYTETADNCDRMTLENLGHWLGLITLQKNIPISLDDLDLKKLIVDSVNKSDQQLLCTVKFIVKILESCKWSQEFRPSHPWVIQMIDCLSKLYLRPNLKLCIKCEIELLYRHLDIEIKDLKPAHVLNYSNIMKQLNERLSANKAVRKSRLLINKVQEPSTVHVSRRPSK